MSGDLGALCVKCGKPVAPNEAATYGGRHEDCASITNTEVHDWPSLRGNGYAVGPSRSATFHSDRRINGEEFYQ